MKKKSKYSEKEYEKLIIASLFHDCVYDPMKNDNEEKSAQFFENCCQDKTNLDIQEIIKQKSYLLRYTYNHSF